MSNQQTWRLDPKRNEYYYFSGDGESIIYQSGQQVSVNQIAAPSTAPLPPPKSPPTTSAPPLPPPPPNHAGVNSANSTSNVIAQIPPPEDGWLPEILKDKSTADLQAVLSNPALQAALTHAPQSAHASLTASSTHLAGLLAANGQAANKLLRLERQLRDARSHTQTRLLALRALERQFAGRQSEQDAALRHFSPRGLFANVAGAVVEQTGVVRDVETRFLEGGEGVAGEREVSEWVRRVREERRLAYLRRERKERWDEGRIGGLRG